MRRRRLHIVTSDSDDDDFECTPRTAVPNHPPHPPSPPQPETNPLVISDDEDGGAFMEAAEVFSPHISPRHPTGADASSAFHGEDIDAEFEEAASAFSPPHSPRPPPAPEAPAPVQFLGSTIIFPPESAQRPGAPPRSWAVEECLRGLGLRLRGEWLETCLEELQSSRPGFGGLSSEEKAKLCFERFMFADMHACGGGVLPENVQALHGVELKGPFVLQVDEKINISAALRDRYRDAPSGPKRCLKLALTDGIQQVFAMEYRPIKELDALAPAGLKVALSNVSVRHGMLLLVPEMFKLLGGLVEDLELARQRLVQEINKPPRGRRREPALTLAERAGRAAWPSSSVNTTAQENSYPSQTNIPAPLSSNVTAERFASVHFRGTTTEFVQPVGAVSHNPRAPVSRTDESTFCSRAPLSSNVTAERFASVHSRGSASEFVQRVGAASHNPRAPVLRTDQSTFCSRGTTGEEPSALHVGAIARNVSPGSTERRSMSEVSTRSEWTTEIHIAPDNDLSVARANTSEITTGSNSRPDTENCAPSNFCNDATGEVLHPVVLSGSNEIPFTYMTCLLARWDSVAEHTPLVQGKVKCFLTGVKSFQFRNRNTYELYVHVDDGSLIYEVLVDDTCVERTIGHSPMVVTAALASTEQEKVSEMKEIMKRFQKFLTNFEGTMLVELNRESSLPIAREMSQGCSVSETRSLLRRLKTLTGTYLEVPIDLSP